MIVPGASVVQLKGIDQANTNDTSPHFKLPIVSLLSFSVHTQCIKPLLAGSSSMKENPQDVHGSTTNQNTTLSHQA